MGGVERVQFDISCRPPRTAYAGDHGNLLKVKLAAFYSRQALGEGGADTTTRAPDVGYTICPQKIIQRVLEIL